MRASTITAFCFCSITSLACFCGSGDDTTTEDSDTSWDSWDWDTEDTATAEIPVMSKTGSYCAVGFGTGEWQAEPGYWQGNKDFGTSKIQCIDQTGEQIFTVELDGVLENDRIRFPILGVDFGQGKVSSWIFHWTVTSGEADWVTDGRTSNGEYLWGHMEGSFELTDEVSGNKMDLDSLELTSWPKF